MAEKSSPKDFVIAMPVNPTMSNSEEHPDTFSTGIQKGSSQENLTQRIVSSTSPTSPLSDKIESPNLNESQKRDKDATPLKSVVEDEEEDEKTQAGNESANWDKWTWLVIFEWVVLVCCTGCTVASLTIDPLKNHVIWGSELWKCFVLVLVFFCSGLFTRWMINIAVFFMCSNFVKQLVRCEKVLYFVHGVRKSVWLCMWVLLVLLTWVLLFDVYQIKRSEKATRIVNLIRRVFCSSLLGTLIWLGKAILVKILASKFQGKRFFRRIRAAILHQHIIEVLNRRHLTQTKINSVIFKWISEFGGMKKASAWTINGFMKVANGSVLIVADADTANKAAIQIFNNLIHQKSKSSMRKKSITKDDLLSYFDNDKDIEQVLRKQFKNEEITNSDFEDWLASSSVFLYISSMHQLNSFREFFKCFPTLIVLGCSYEKVYNQRNSLARSLTDSKTAIEELERLANVIVAIVILVFWLYQMRILTIEALVFTSSQLLLLTFMFGNTLKTVFEAIIFVFVVHPFDVNDYCVIDGEQLLVDEMNLNTTIFLKDDREKVYYPNSVLATKPISNFYRSDKNIVDSIEFTVDASTNANQIRSLRKDIKGYMQSHDDCYSDPSVVVEDFDDVNKIKLGVYFRHTINFQNYGKKRKRRSKIVLKLKEILESHQIKFHFLPKEASSDGKSSPLPLAKK
ncbi:hypothetical protein SLEP1_g34373 [Rubroshorea leprosula]|uniref:Mechanosensitive ion channel MscS domain-containing protein n=1 Tax=Rubroshorea leprosula TaxID=152421 RepID=A0AAV5KJL6_9ROSI|nr:hypothetical protein SLEP1_g34371 [Rubroshorea leprosula]GKV24807.1 hypothetical protein SLEP1_g34373 [Rubroshorea leprosula]